MTSAKLPGTVTTAVADDGRNFGQKEHTACGVVKTRTDDATVCASSCILSSTKNEELVVMAAYDRGGLGNRIKCLVSAWRHDPHAKFKWEVTPSCPIAHMSELFETDHGLRDGEPHRTHCTWRLEVWPQDPVPRDFSVVREWYGTNSHWRDIDFEFSRIPSAMVRIYLPLFRRLQPHPLIAQCVHAFMTRHQCTVGVHIRSWHDDAERHSTLFDLPSVVAVIRQVLMEEPTARLFVCSDDRGVRDAIQNTFGEMRVRVLNSDMLGSRAVWAEMLILSMCRTIIASYISTMSEVAWWMGGCRARVIVPRKNRPSLEYPRNEMYVDV